MRTQAWNSLSNGEMTISTNVVAGGPTPLNRPPFTTNGYTLETAADIVAIQQLLVRYCHILDNDRSEARDVSQLYTADGDVIPAYEGDRLYHGREAIEKWYADYLLKTREGSKIRRHLISSTRIEVQDKTGWAFSLLDAQGIQVDTRKLAFYAGSYEDVLVKIGSRWFFKSRRINLDYKWQAPEFDLCRNGQQVWDQRIEQ